MIDFDALEEEIKKGKMKNSYIFCGLDEELIKEGINLIVKKIIDESLIDLNYIRLDGTNVSFDDILNASETMPFMGDRKLVVVYRAAFLKDKTDSSLTKLYNDVNEYLKDMPSHTTLIIYTLFNDKRESPKKSNKLKALDKVSEVVYFDRLKKDRYYKKVEEVFKERGKEINKIEARYFAEKVQNNFDIIKREADKIIAYTEGREIKRQDIDKLIATSSEDDIFDLIELISTRKVEKAMDLLDGLLFRSDQHMLIITNVENNFKRLYEIKILLEKGYKNNDLATKYRLPNFICDKLIGQCNKFTKKQLQNIMEICLETDIKLKTTANDKTIELELMLFKIFMIK